MAANIIDSNEIAILLGKQRDAMKNMLEILEQEYQALKKNDINLFDTILEKKHLQTRELETLESQLTPLLSLMGGKIDRQQLENYIQNIDNEHAKHAAQTVWEELLGVLKRCNEQNKINHKIIESSRIHIRQALDILRGETGIPRLYSASGKEKTDAHGGSIAIA
jgi:flagellar biosynthesis/type III secretory pathway chaperone